MKNIIFILIVLLTNTNLQKKYFELYTTTTKVDNKEGEFFKRIIFKSKNEFERYPLNTKKYSEAERLDMIEELLKFKGDSSINADYASNYNTRRIFLNLPKDKKKVSIQVEALFLINQISLFIN